MDHPRILQSELLQSRLREHKAEPARDSRRTNPQSNHSTPGRDDDIFTEAEAERRDGTTGTKHFQSSPAAPSSWRYDRESSRTRRTTALSSSTNNTPRAMGVREMEDHIDKLSKQNFDLKMEVFHRREKVEQLEKRLQDYPQLEEDLNAALDANEELVDALEARDRAVDEAVVMITELEQRNQELEQQLADAKAAAARAASVSGVPAQPMSPGRRPQKTPQKSRDRRSLRGGVSPDVSARMVELAISPDEQGETGPIPSFLKSKEPTTAALRSMYVEDDQVVRPIPSYATLLSNINSDGNAERADNAMDGMKSPGLSELSESDLRSIYGPEQSPHPERNGGGMSPPPPQQQQEQMSQQANARVSRWVADRAISPAKPSKSGKPSGDGADGFQSLDHVLTRQPVMPQIEAPAKPNSRRPRTHQQSEKDGHTPPMPLNPVFGQNTFPPTPDTMVTRPSNNSTTSFGQEGNPFETSSGSSRAPPASTPQSQPALLVSPHPRRQVVTPGSFLPQEFDAYGSPPREQHRGGYDGAQDMGDTPQSRGYSSDGSYIAEPIRRPARQRQASLTGSTAIDADSLRDVPHAQSSPSPASFFDSSRRSGELARSVLLSRPKPDLYVGYPDPQQHFYRVQDTPTHSSFTTRNHSRAFSSTSSVQTPRAPPPLPAAASNGVLWGSKQAPPPTGTATSTPSAKSTTSLAARTASIRHRFLRRKTASSAVEEAPMPAVAARANGIAQRLGFRRSSSEQGPRSTVPGHDTEQLGSAAKSSPTAAFWSSEKGLALSGDPNSAAASRPQRSKSERRRPSMSITSRSNLSNTSFNSFSGQGKAATPTEQYFTGDEGSTSPAARPRRPSLSGRLSSSGGGGKKRGTSKSDIPPVPNTPTDHLKCDSEPEPAHSKWRLGGRGRSTSRSRVEGAWPATLTGIDGTSAGKRG